MHHLPIIVVRGARAGIHHNCSIQNGIRRIFPPATRRQPFFNSPQKGRTVNTTPTAETLPDVHGRQAATERSARAAHVHAHCARARRDVRQQERGMPVRRIVVGCAARFQYEDAQVWVRRRETACDDAASGAAYQTYFLSEEEWEGGRDCAPPAIMISYSSFTVVGVDIVPLLLQP